MKFIPAQDQRTAVLSLEDWQAQGGEAVALPNDLDVSTIAAKLPQLSVITLDFPKWVDGRAYTQARLLRARHRFTGEIRAVGEVLVDMLPLLARTGFDAVQLRADQDEAAARRALGFFPIGHYQGDVHEPRPEFAR